MQHREERPAIKSRKGSAVDTKRDISLEGNIRFLNSIEFPAELMCCRYDNNGKLLALGLSNGTIKVYSLENRSVVYSLQATGNHKNLPVTCIRWKPDEPDQQYGNVLVATYASGCVRFWHVTTGKCLRTYEEPKVQMMTCAYNNTGNRVLVGRSDGKIDIHDEETGKIIMVMEPSTNPEIMDGHVMRIFSALYNPSDDNVFVSGGWDDTVQWWDTRLSDKYSIKKIVGPHICGEGLDINPYNSNMVVASWRKDHNLQIYDFGSGRVISEIMSDLDDRSMLYCVQWLNRDTITCGGSHGNTMKYIDVVSKQTVGRVHSLPGAVYSIDNNRRASHQVVGVCSSQTLYLVEDTM